MIPAAPTDENKRMLEDPLVTVMTFGTPQEAAVAQGFLENHGIESFAQGCEAANTLFIVGTALGGVRVQVASSQAENARRLLTEEFESSPPIQAWTCPQCGERVDAGYEVCWSCGTVLEEDALERHPAEALDAEISDEERADAILHRAWIAALLGFLFFPFGLYALWLVLSFSKEHLRNESRVKYWATFGVSMWHLFFLLVGVGLILAQKLQSEPELVPWSTPRIPL